MSDTAVPELSAGRQASRQSDILTRQLEGRYKLGAWPIISGCNTAAGTRQALLGVEALACLAHSSAAK